MHANFIITAATWVTHVLWVLVYFLSNIVTCAQIQSISRKLLVPRTNAELPFSSLDHVKQMQSTIVSANPTPSRFHVLPTDFDFVAMFIVACSALCYYLAKQQHIDMENKEPIEFVYIVSAMSFGSQHTSTYQPGCQCPNWLRGALEFLLGSIFSCCDFHFKNINRSCAIAS